MTTLPVTFPVGYPSHYFTEMDCVAHIGPDGVEEITAHDYTTNETVTVSGDLEKSVILYVSNEMTHKLAEAMVEVHANMVRRDRIVGRAA